MGRRKSNSSKLGTKEYSNTTMLTRKAKKLQEIESIDRVFGNPLLMDKIVKYSIYKFNGKQTSAQSIVSLRLVNKSWLQSTSRVLAKSGEAAIGLIVGCRFGVDRLNAKIYDNAGVNILDHFVSVFSRTTRSVDSILPVYVYLQQPYLIDENFGNLRNFLKQCGDIICILCVTYPIDGGSLKFKFSTVNFSILRVLNFFFEKWSDPVTYILKEPKSENNSNGLTFLQNILQNSPCLQSFTIVNGKKSVVNTGSIILPITVKCMTFGAPTTDDELALFTKNRLPNLNLLEIDIYEETEIHTTYKILEHFQQQLTILNMDVNVFDAKSRIFVKLPLMEKLKCLKLSGKNYALSPELRNVWPKLVPNLGVLVLKNLSETLFFEWVQGLRFENVKKFQCSLKRSNDDDDDDDECTNTLSPSVQIITEIITCFPKIEKLTLNFTLSEISSLKYLFKNLTNLNKLNLTFQREDSDNLPGYKLICIFLGISMELATALVDHTVKSVKVPVDNPESVMNLTELTSLTLKAPNYYFPSGKDQVFSKVISKHGLDKMSKLQKIKLLGGFEVDNNDDDSDD